MTSVVYRNVVMRYITVYTEKKLVLHCKDRSFSKTDLMAVSNICWQSSKFLNVRVSDLYN